MQKIVVKITMKLPDGSKKEDKKLVSFPDGTLQDVEKKFCERMPPEISSMVCAGLVSFTLTDEKGESVIADPAFYCTQTDCPGHPLKAAASV